MWIRDIYYITWSLFTVYLCKHSHEWCSFSQLSCHNCQSKNVNHEYRELWYTLDATFSWKMLTVFLGKFNKSNKTVNNLLLMSVMYLCNLVGIRATKAHIMPQVICFSNNNGVIWWISCPEIVLVLHLCRVYSLRRACCFQYNLCMRRLR